MRKYFSLFLLFAICSSLFAQMNVSGILDTSVSMNVGAGDSPEFLCGFEEFANIRFQSRMREKGVVHGAVNLIAASGSYAAGMAAMGVNPIGENFITAIELERLYFRLNGEYTDLDCGLFRLPFGYGQVWGPSDFLNPKNPLKPDARPRAILGAALNWYPNDDLKIQTFSAAPRNPFAFNGEGWLMGIAGDQHWEKFSLQALYSYEMPIKVNDLQTEDSDSSASHEVPAGVPGSKYGIHRAGFSVKADLEAGFVMEALYTYNHEEWIEKGDSLLDGLSFSIGADYSLLDGDLILLAEYLFNGNSSSTAKDYGGDFFNNHYLYAGLTWLFADFTNISFAVICGLNDISFTPIISLNHELFQGAALTVTAQVPMDRDLFFDDGNRGEFGPIRPDDMQPLPLRFGSYFNLSARIRLRF